MHATKNEKFEQIYLQKTTDFPAVLYKIDKKVQKLAFKFLGIILLSDCKWGLDAAKPNAALRPWPGLNSELGGVNYETGLKILPFEPQVKSGTLGMECLNG